MKRLNNVNEVFTLNFNLRQPKGNKKTNVYAVIKINGRQIKTPIDCKINPWNWDKRKQVPKFSNNMTEEDRENAQHVFNVIYEWKMNFQKYYVYICRNYVIPNEKELMEKVVKKVRIQKDKEIKETVKPAKKRDIKATTVLKKALELYPTLYPTIAKSTLETYDFQLRAFINYCKDINKDTVKMLTDDGLKEFEVYLSGKKETVSKIRNSLRVLITLINKCLVKHPYFKNMGFKKVTIDLPKEQKTEGKKVPLTEEEIEKLRNNEGLTPKEIEYRDLFLLAVYTGQRASDLHRFFTKDYTVEGNYFVFYNQKKKVEAIIEQTPEVMEILERYKDGFKNVDINAKKLSMLITNNLKMTAEKLGLNREIRYIENGEEKVEPLYEIIGSQFGRHTFITEKLKSGMVADTVKYLSGHKDTQAIYKNYSHLTATDKIGILEHTNVDNTLLYQKGREDKEKELIEETKKVLLFLGANYMDIVDINDLDRLMPMIYAQYEPQVTQYGISVKDLKGLFNAEGITLREKRDKLQQWIDEFIAATDLGEKGK